MIRLLIGVAVLSFAGAAIAPVAAWFVDAKMSKDVILITPAPPDIVELNKAMWSKGEPVANIYGEPVDKSIRVVRPDPRDVIVPEENPSMILMNAGGERHPLQVQTVWVAVKYGSPSAAAGGAALLAFALILARRRKKHGPREEAEPVNGVQG